MINFAPPGTVCGNPANTNCDRADSCDGTGTCSANISVVGTTCGDSDNTTCDGADSCNGAGMCLQNFASGGTSCGNTTNEDCNAPDSCSGTGTCLANLSAAGTSCGDATNDDCDTPDTCNAIGDCNDNFIAIGTACGDSTNDQCDLLDTCNGMGTCNDNFIPAGTACGDGTSGDCDLADSCNGAGDCADNFIAINTSCGDAVPSPCDAADTCDSTGTCLDNVFSNGTNCDDGNACTSVSSCLIGVCEATTVLACEALWCFDNGGFTTVPNVGTGSANYGAGLGALGSNVGNTLRPTGCPGGASNAMSATNWTQGSFASALSTSDCYVFEAATGLDPLVLSFDNQRGANGPTQWGVAVQTEPGAVLQTVTINQATGPAFASSPMRIVSLESLELDVQNAAVIHICGYGAISAGSDWRVDNVRIFSGGCSDGVENGNETDPDCGGPDCAPCT
ncbi:MAG: hypothetical protein JKY56_14515 [Kofleriaceae bacterium]|nr:hypothetical protein [Kofleriaceae bacterium]